MKMTNLDYLPSRMGSDSFFYMVLMPFHLRCWPEPGHKNIMVRYQYIAV